MLRSGICLAIGMLLPLTLGVVPPAAANPLLVFDSASGAVLRAEEAGVPWYPASLTKLMTAYLVFEAIRDGGMALETEISVSANARAQPPSKIGLPVGSRITVDKALEALIVRSANDIAVVLAEAVGGSESRFVEMMNVAARQLGMTGTYFANPHGLPDPRQVTTARDLGLLTMALIRQFPEHAGYFTMKEVRIGKRTFSARNSLLREWAEADGMKTGFICASGYNLIATATHEKRRLVAVVLGASSGNARTELAKRVLLEGFSQPRSLGRSVSQFTNGGFFQRTPTDMRPLVCEASQTVDVAKPGLLTGWLADFGRFPTATGAEDAMSDNMIALRNVIYAGRGTVVKDFRTDSFAAVMAGLDSGQAQVVCEHLNAAHRKCVAAAPGWFVPPKAASGEEDAEDAPVKPRKKPRVKSRAKPKVQVGRKVWPAGTKRSVSR